MKLPVILLYVAVTFILLALLAAFVCFRIVFYASRRNENHEEISIPAGKAYEPYREEIISWTKRKRASRRNGFPFGPPMVSPCGAGILSMSPALPSN